MKTKYETAADAIAANPEHPVVIHGEYCKAKMADASRRDKIDGIILSHFNR